MSAWVRQAWAVLEGSKVKLVSLIVTMFFFAVSGFYFWLSYKYTDFSFRLMLDYRGTKPEYDKFNARYARFLKWPWRNNR